MDSSNINYNLIDQVASLARKSGVPLTRKEAYGILRQNGVIKRNGLPTKMAIDFGLVKKIPNHFREHGNRKEQTVSFYRHLLASIPGTYIKLLENDSKLNVKRESIKALMQTKYLFLHVPFEDFSTKDLGATIYFSYKLLYDMRPTLTSFGKRFLRTKFNNICEIYVKRVGNVDKALDKIGSCIKGVKEDEKSL